MEWTPSAVVAVASVIAAVIAGFWRVVVAITRAQVQIDQAHAKLKDAAIKAEVDRDITELRTGLSTRADANEVSLRIANAREKIDQCATGEHVKHIEHRVDRLETRIDRGSRKDPE